MNCENDFYREIADVPDLPSDLYGCIEKKIRKHSFTKKVLYALAASVVLLIGTYTVISNSSSRNDVLQAEVANELQTIHDYLNSSDLESDLAMYAVVEGY